MAGVRNRLAALDPRRDRALAGTACASAVMPARTRPAALERRSCCDWPTPAAGIDSTPAVEYFVKRVEELSGRQPAHRGGGSSGRSSPPTPSSRS